jgi:hypothetical protein
LKKLIQYFILSYTLLLLPGCGSGETEERDKANSYQSFVTSLPKDDPNSISLALQRFRESFDRGAAQVNDSAFLDFSGLYDSVLIAVNDRLFEDNFLMHDLYEQKRTEQTKSFINSLNNNGFELLSSEGFYYAGEESDFLYKNFKDFTSKEISEYLRIRSKEMKEGFAEDAGLIIPLDSVAQRVVVWEEYLNNYPESPMAPQALRYYRLYISTYLTGLDNTPLVDEKGVISSEARSSYQRYIKNYKDKESGKVIEEYYTMLEQRNFKPDDEEVYSFLNKHELDMMLGVQPLIR